MAQHKFQININGDTAETLKNEFIEVMTAARILEERLSQMTSHLRNYQVNTDSIGDFNHDRDKRVEHLLRVRDVYDWAVEGAQECILQTGG